MSKTRICVEIGRNKAGNATTFRVTPDHAMILDVMDLAAYFLHLSIQHSGQGIERTIEIIQNAALSAFQEIGGKD